MHNVSLGGSAGVYTMVAKLLDSKYVIFVIECKGKLKEIVVFIRFGIGVRVTTDSVCP